MFQYRIKKNIRFYAVAISTEFKFDLICLEGKSYNFAAIENGLSGYGFIQIIKRSIPLTDLLIT
jgi:hypothetical protein